MAKNSVVKKEQKTSQSQNEQDVPVVMDALDDVLITSVENDVTNEAALQNPVTFDAAQSPWTPESPSTQLTTAEQQPEAITPDSLAPQESLQPTQETEVPPALVAEQQPLPSRGIANQALVSQQVTAPVKSEVQIEVETILAEGLVDMYKTMTPQEQIAFRKKGEEVTTAIEGMMQQFKATTKKVIVLIREWLRLIPRVNRYFLEQESKIKTDEIIKLQRKLKKERKNRVETI